MDEEDQEMTELDETITLVQECTTMLQGLNISLEVFLGEPNEPIEVRGDILKTMLDIANYRGALVIGIAQLVKQIEEIPEDDISVAVLEAEQVRSNAIFELLLANNILSSFQFLVNLQNPQ